MAHSDEQDSERRTLNIVEASIADLQHALTTGALTSVELTTKYLQRIITYDTRGPCLNSIVVFNPAVFDEAAESDARRAAGRSLGNLDGIPFTLKDSMMTKGLTCASGSPAFANLTATRNSFVASQLRSAGAVLIGKTNTPPMMASGMHRGLYGRAESPYNLSYLTAAFSSGSSNGCATSTAASFAAFGLGSETVSSGRSPASNNGLVAYTPSRTVISTRGIWPLYPTCDVVVPHTRTVTDMLTILDYLTVEDSTTEGDFWRQQTFVSIPKVERPRSYLDLLPGAADSLRGKRIAVPKMYIGGHDPKAKPTTVSPGVIALWKCAREDLEALGAEVVETDFPLVTNYEDDSVSGHANNVVGFDPDWNAIERGELVAYSWDDFLAANDDPKIKSLADIDGSQLFPARPEGYPPDRWLETKNFLNYPLLPHLASLRPLSTPTLTALSPGLRTALPALESQRHRDLDLFLSRQNLDLVAFPSCGDVAESDVDTNEASAEYAMRNGVRYSHGNRAVRHMGVPTVTVTMGVLEGKGMPVGLTFAGGHGADGELLRFAYAFERGSGRRVAPPGTPGLESDVVELGRRMERVVGRRGEGLEMVDVEGVRIGETRVRVSGRLRRLPMGTATTTTTTTATTTAATTTTTTGAGTATVTAWLKQPGSYLNLSAVKTEVVHDERWELEADYEPFEPVKPLYGGYGQGVGKVMVILRAETATSQVGNLVMIDRHVPIVVNTKDGDTGV
ncbi:hypothetical protein LTR48_002808 [Friedmanniomyces endolithicus]|uniref:Amidase domain-containing protein n=2 Tax=Dothideomycetidae TaxID=451867 RepID=A0A4U0V5R2_9PEZI|nr:hypothetical protein LTS09_000263 [Friedmanniomyces endolithicus]KAK0944514.1 hypothetical protein LTR29_003976 [Friedmanniomyces endolithicus]KAK1093202.1 hypothetical protein LTR48_002808 [Friedmanniomyces endolithicus]KAK5141247.1 hypothetical protein LTR32_006145 [Rachicladosporium monterosium]TKA44034.1 hypothetical protein B0A54_04800 [Friedmanniomyces endolithicus]